MSTTNADVDALQFALHLACSEFVGPEHMADEDEDALAIRFVYEGLPVGDAIDLANLICYGTEPIPPMPDHWQAWLDNPPRRELDERQRAAIEAMKESFRV